MVLDVAPEENDVLLKSQTAEEDSRYEKLLREYEEFAYVVSHDLQAPIRQLKGLTDILFSEMEASLSPQQEACREMVEHVAVEAEKTLDALLVFSRLNTDTKNIVEVDLNEVVADTVKKLGVQTGDIEYDISIDEMPTVYGDYDLLVQAFYHLIGNAIKFQPEGQKPDIQVNVTNKNGQNVFSITDNGIGIDPEKTEIAFVILRKLNADDSYSGRGTGLTFAKKIIEIHNGDIWIDPKPDGGAKVAFTLNLNSGDAV